MNKASGTKAAYRGIGSIDFFAVARKSKNAYNHLNILKQLEKDLNNEGQDLIRKDIKILEYGIQGENNIIFELEASIIPMYVLHDINLIDGDKTSQIDFMVFTHKICFVI